MSTGAKRKFDVHTLVHRYEHLGPVPDSKKWKSNKEKANKLGDKHPSTGINTREPANYAASST
jgi:hypothetical protein